MLKLLFTIAILAGLAFKQSTANGSCRNANWQTSFDRTGWSKCPGTFPYINGLYRSKASQPRRDYIYHLEQAKCCGNGNSNAECVQANWVTSFDRSRNWNLCPSGYYLSGLYRSGGNNLHNIEHAWCCKPRGAPNSYKSCYNENVWSRFDWNRQGMVSCTRSGYYITGMYRSSCNYMYCIEEFKCCQLQTKEVSPCASAPCLNGGVCTNQGKIFKCTCPKNYHGDRCQTEAKGSSSCRNANWQTSFDRTGWSKCPSTFPYINGLYRSKASQPRRDYIYHLEQAKCCGNGNSNAECVQANWVSSFDRSRNWNLCPSGYYLSGLYRSGGNNLHNIEHAWCCKPRGATNSYKSCYNENVWSRFDWNRQGMVSCTRSGYYITGMYRSSCNYMYCIEEFKCCQLKTGEEKATCSATGDPHYRTFDGRTIHFQGECQYVLAKDTDKKFTVLGKNKLCGNRVTCTSEVTIKVKDLEIVIKRGGVVTVFGIVKGLPYTNRGVTIKKLGRVVEVTTDVGLTVSYDCVYNVYITVSGKYRGKTRGICGNYNGNPNDLLKSDNRVTGNDQDFANSWKVDQSCPNSPGPVDPCKAAGAQAKEAKKKCGLLRGNPFSACHNHVKVDPGFIQDCEYDVCACKDNHVSCLCEEYDAYATTCGFAGVNIKWKHLAQFSQCGSPCASAPCLNGGVCTNQGKKFKCTCPQDYHGDRCQTEVKATCSATGDPHYRTFDGKTYNFMGHCEYVLAKDTDNKFTVLGRNRPCGDLSRRPQRTCTYAVTVKTKGLDIKILRGGLVQMLGKNVKLPYNNQGVRIVKHGGRTVRVTTDIGLSVQYDGVYNVFVTVYGRYKGKTLGLCGTFTGNTNDDFKKPDNKVTTNIQEFGISWKVDKNCRDSGPDTNPCDKAGALAQEAKKKCGVLRALPFSACNHRVKVDSGFIQDCEYDVCACKDHPLSCLCEELDAYATTCSYVGVNIQWRKLAKFRECQSPCALAPCLNGGTCKNVGNSYRCSCPVGFKGSRCETEDTATCSATGDPHYKTFDAKKYNFMGLCEYVLSKDLDNNFLVLTKNERCYGRYSCVFSITVSVKGLKIGISRGGQFTVFGIAKNAPYINHGVTVSKRGARTIRIDTDIGVTVEYDGVYNVFVTLSARYRGKTAGLCGNYNGNTNDEFLDINFQRSHTILHFADSWKVDHSCPNSPNPGNPCLTASSIAQKAKKKCQLLKQQPFAKCHNSVNQDSGFIKDCEYDVCVCNNHPSSCLCEEFAAYATSCSLVGVPITWKNLPQFAECNSPCAAGPCRNGATCSNQGKDYKCTCAGYTGKQCETQTCKNPKALGMESGKIADSQVTASSVWSSSHGASNARLNFVKNSRSWSSKRNDLKQWLQVDFKYRATITDILTQGRGRYNQWVRSYTVSYSNDGASFKPYQKSGKDRVFVSNVDMKSIVKNTLQPVIVARFIRIHPKTWHNHISMRVEFNGCFEGQPCAEEPCQNEGKCSNVGGKVSCSCLAGYYGDRCEQKECKQPLRLGVENGEIPDSQISASSEWDANHGAINSRLNFRAQGRRQGAWSSRPNNLKQWLQVNFVRQATVTEILTQGRSNANQWVTSYTVSHSNDGLNFFAYRVNGVVKVFGGNRDRNTIVRQNVSPVIVTKYIRIHPKQWHRHISMRVGFRGCLKEWPCEAKPCRNGGTCLDYRGGYLCACAKGWAGKNCEQNVGNCVPKK